MDGAGRPRRRGVETGRPRVVIVGGGFGGLSAARRLADVPVDVLLVDRRNHHLFQPLLYQVATAGLSPAEIAMPIRSVLSRQPNASVLLGELRAVDLESREIEVMVPGEAGRLDRIAFDFLVLATGARHAYFGHDEWEPFAPGLKTIEDATAIRHRLLMAFERAELTDDAAERNRLLTIVVIGGGPTGVEMAGAIAELARKALAADFRRIDPPQTRIILIEAGARILAGFPEHLSQAATRSLHRLGIEVRTGAAVTACDEWGVSLGEQRIDAATVIWGAGVQASPVARWLGVDGDRAGRVRVAADFSLPGHASVFVIGDCCSLVDAAGVTVPGVAPGAKQAGQYVARVIAARVSGGPAPAAFRYVNWGNLATIGRRAAVGDFGFLKVKGPLAWYLWGLVHVFYLIGFRNRLVVLLDWAWSFVTFRRGARLITGPWRERRPDPGDRS